MPLSTTLASSSARGFGGLRSFVTAVPDTGVMFPIGMVSVGSAGSANIEFTSIPGTYKHLQIRGIANNGEASGWNNQAMQINSDTSSSYKVHYVAGNGSSASAGISGTDTSINDIFRISATSTGYFGSFIIDILDYTSTTKNKTIRSLNGGDGNGNGWVGLHSGLYYATPAAVTSVKLISSVGNFGQYSSFALYGIKGEAE